MLTALIGTLLRFMFVVPLDIPVFSNILHTHSHFAILGWIYNALFLALVFIYVKDTVKQKKYNILFWITQVSIVGMLVTFTWQGYAAFSIAFSTLHIFCEYIFIYYIYCDIKASADNSLSVKFIIASLFFLFLSSLGPWALVIIILSGLSSSNLYTQSIYFYLHFQYNGWFIFAFIGMWLKLFITPENTYNTKKGKTAFYLLFTANIFAYFLSLLGFEIHPVLKFTGLISAFVQILALRFIYSILFLKEDSVFSRKDPMLKLLFRISFFSLLLKFILQLVSAMPEAGNAAFVSREIAIGYLHLVMLGVVSAGLISWFGVTGIIMYNSIIFKYGVVIFLASFLLSELLLFYPALVIWFGFSPVSQYSLLLFILSFLMFAGTLLIYFASRKNQ